MLNTRGGQTCFPIFFIWQKNGPLKYTTAWKKVEVELMMMNHLEFMYLGIVALISAEMCNLGQIGQGIGGY